MTHGLRLGGDLTLGYACFFLSYVGIGLFNDCGLNGEHFWYPICCTMGALANTSFVAGSLGLLFSGKGNKRLRLARYSGLTGSILSLLVILPLALSTELNGLYIGHGLWVASFLALAIGISRVNQRGITNE